MTRRLKLVVLVVGLGAWAMPEAARAQVVVPPLTDRIEEDWELLIKRPNSNRVGPQITTTMRMADDRSAPFFAFNLNYRDQPSFTPGGMQASAWAGRTLGGTSTSGTALLETRGEQISWTQSLSLADGTLRFAVKNGRSVTWGQFGQDQGLGPLSLPTSITSLVGYDPAESRQRSAAGWQGNRTSYLALVRVRYYLGDTLLRTDDLTTGPGG